MKVLLIVPVPPRTSWPKGLFRVWTFDTRLACAARVLQRAGHEVRIIHREHQLIKLRFDWKQAEAELHDSMAAFRPDMVVQAVVTPAMPEAAQISRWARQIVGSRVINVLCGMHPSGVPELTLNECHDVDAIALGEYELTLRDIADHGITVETPGLAVRHDDRCERTTPRAAAQDVDSLGPPAYDMLDMEFLTQPNPWTIRYLPLSSLNIRTSRGCPGRCVFCAEHFVSGLGVRFHSTEYVMDQVEYACERLGVQAIHFEDETFGADPVRLRAVCEAMQSRGFHRRLQWDCLMRVDQAAPELLRAMKAAGCIQVEYGFESGSDNALRRLGKRATVEQNRRTVQLTREAGIRIFADLMVGLPGETREDLNRTMRFLHWARPEVLSAGRLLPMPGTGLYDQLSESIRASLSWEGFSYTPEPGFRINFTAMPDDEFERWYTGFLKYVVKPHNAAALLRDGGLPDEATRQEVRRRLRRFSSRHPLRALRLPITRTISAT